ncbi:MAG: SMC-Scp complex subunit ScpB [Proteobacteria bacterium]|nr:SMC-Scp complex subunit ScpB [Pseudomonadota bacterium]
MDQGYTLKETQDALDELMEFYRDRAGGFHLKYVKRMGYQFQTTSAAKALMERQFSSRPRPLSRASLETLAVIAYRQKSNKAGVTRAEVEFIRGVDAGSIFKTLVERKLLACVGRKEIPGRPMIFGITDEFLKVFQLGSINDLPPLESFQTPGDVINAANEKIAKFEAEEDGVNPESFVGDEAYTDSLGTSDADILGDDASGLTPSVRTSVRTIDIEALESHPSDHIPSEIMAEMVADAFDDATDDERSAERQAAQEIAIPAAIIEEMAADLMDRLEEGEIAFPILDVIERSIEGASSVAGEHATEAETGFVSDCDDHVSKSRHENV